MEKSKEFYNQFQEKLIRDYVKGNIRMEAAIKNSLHFMPERANTVLDIGCGIGWSSYEFYRNRGVQVTGVDLSDNSIAVAQKLFANSHITYKVADVTSDDFQIQNTFDYIALIDVYEHIPMADRGKFNKSLAELLNDNSAVFLSCPSVYHQDYLRKHKPEGLQPVDEDVTEEDLKKLADVIGGELYYFEYQNLGRDKDYFHALITKGKFTNFKNNSFELEPKEGRKKRVKNNLKKYAFITREGENKNLRDIIQLRTRLKKLIKWIK